MRRARAAARTWPALALAGVLLAACAAPGAGHRATAGPGSIPSPAGQGAAPSAAPSAAPTETSAPSPSTAAPPIATAAPAPTRTPRPLASVTLELAGQTGGTTAALARRGSWACAGIGPRLAVLDMAHPGAPRQVGETAPLPGLVRAIAMGERYAYVGVEAQLLAVDLARPEAPQPAGPSVALPGRVLALALTERGLCALTLDGGPDAPLDRRHLLAFDLANPAAPHQAGALALAGDGGRLAVSGAYAYVVTGNTGLQAVDLADPATPRVVGTLAAGWPADDVAVVDAHACVAGSGRLHVVDLQHPAQPREVAMLPIAEGAQLRVAIAGPYAVLAVGRRIEESAYGYLQLVDLAGPTQPRLLGRLELGGVPSLLTSAGGVVCLVEDDEESAVTLRTLDLRDPANPRLAGALPLPDTYANLVVSGDVACVTAAGGVRVLDLADPAHPRQAGAALWANLDTHGALYYPYGLSAAGGVACLTTWLDDAALLDVRDAAHPRWAARLPGTQGAHGVVVAGGYAYLAGGPGLLIYDVADPDRPQEAGFVNLGHEALWVALAGERAYLWGDRGGSACTLWIADVAEPALPRPRVSSLAFADPVIDVAPVGQYAYVTTQAYPAQGGRAALHVVDLAEPAQPRPIAALDLPGAGRLAVAGGRAYVAGHEALSIVDLSDPTAPQLVGSYATPCGLQGLQAAGDDVYIADCRGLLDLRVREAGS